MVDNDFEIALDKHLRREELLFRAKHCEHGCNVSWLAPSCANAESIKDMLRYLGFRIKRVVVCDDAEWVETTSGVLVFVNWDGGEQGFMCGGRK